MKLAIIVLTLVLLFGAENEVLCANDKLDDVFRGVPTVKCNKKTEQKVEDLLPVLLPAGTDQHIPETKTELRQYCNLVNKHMPYVLGVFKHCTNQFTRTIAKFMFFPLRKQLDNVCKGGKPSRAANELMKAGKCGNLARDRLKECNNQLIDSLNGISMAPIKEKINMVCCHSNAYRQCLREATEETVGCTRHTVDWAERFVLKMVGGSISLVCGEYFQESDKCDKLIKETPVPKYSESNKRPSSFVKPMLQLMESFPDFDAN